MKGKKKAAVIVGICVLVLLLLLSGLYIAVTWNTTPKEEKPEPSAALLEDVVKGTLSGEEIRVTDEEMNAYLVYLGKQSQDQLLQDMMLGITDDNRLQIWVTVPVNGMQITAYCSVIPEFSDGNILLHIQETCAGALPLPPSVVLSLVEGYLPDEIQVQGDALVVQAPAFSLKEQGLDISVALQDMHIEDGEFILRTDSVSKAIQQLLEQLIGQLFSTGKETLTDAIGLG